MGGKRQFRLLLTATSALALLPVGAAAQDRHTHAHGDGAAHTHAHAPAVAVLAPTEPAAGAADADGRRWLAGDHHVHSEFSADYEPDPTDPTAPPVPVLGVDGRYPVLKNATMGRQFGLSWMVTTDHGGPNHSRLNHEQTYPALLAARRDVPEIVHFYGMEFDTPGGDHSSLIIPGTPAERETLRSIEFGFSEREAWPLDPARDTEPKMIEALRFMRDIAAPPLVIANHPSRSATDVGVYGQYRPAEFRDWNDTAPMVAVGMEGAPGHQAGALNSDGSLDPEGARGGYRRSPTRGGYDQMTARLGGFWDSMLGEGRRWWVTSTSDSHRHYSEGGSDFWPGEYSKTWVHARAEHADILDGLRHGRVFVATGDLVSELDVTVTAGGRSADIGGELHAPDGEPVVVTIRLRDPSAVNAAGQTPAVVRVDLILGDVTGPATDRTLDANPTTRVVHRFTATDWTRDGEVLTMTHTLTGLGQGHYVRVRGTSTAELEPTPDAPGEDPWADLWFYSNPVFLELAGR
jgi:hypothetical protein